MDALELLRNRITGVHLSMKAVAEELTDVDLSTPVAPATSPLGLTLWHLARSQDWIVQTVIRDVPEVADSWQGPGLPDHLKWGIGIGLTPAEAEEVAGAVTLDGVLGYADAVYAEIDGWLSGLDATDLDRVADWTVHKRRRPVYAQPVYDEEAGDLHDKPVGILLVRPVISHVFWHLGEIDLLGQLAKS